MLGFSQDTSGWLWYPQILQHCWKFLNMRGIPKLTGKFLMYFYVKHIGHLCA